MIPAIRSKRNGDIRFLVKGGFLHPRNSSNYLPASTRQTTLPSENKKDQPPKTARLLPSLLDILGTLLIMSTMSIRGVPIAHKAASNKMGITGFISMKEQEAILWALTRFCVFLNDSF